MDQYYPRILADSKGVHRAAIILDSVLHYNMTKGSQTLPDGFGLVSCLLTVTHAWSWLNI